MPVVNMLYSLRSFVEDMARFFYFRDLIVHDSKDIDFVMHVLIRNFCFVFAPPIGYGSSRKI